MWWQGAAHRRAAQRTYLELFLSFCSRDVTASIGRMSLAFFCFVFWWIAASVIKPPLVCWNLQFFLSTRCVPSSELGTFWRLRLEYGDDGTGSSTLNEKTKRLGVACFPACKR